MNTSAIPQDAPAAAALANLPIISDPQTGRPSRVEDAARQFEALLIDQMLRTAKETDSGDSEDDGSSSSTMLDIANQQFSQLLAKNGGLGLAKLIVEGLHRGEQRADPQPAANAT
jgi:Rod binding domain-containing protein